MNSKFLGVMEWCSQSNPRKKFKRDNEDENRMSVKAKSLLYLFIEYVWDENDGQLSNNKDVELINWLKSKNLSMNDEFWFLSHQLDVRTAPRMKSMVNINVDDKYQQRIRDINNHRIFAKIAYNLRKSLAFLVSTNDNVNYAGEDGRTILHVFFEEYLRSIDRSTQEDQSKVQILIKKLTARGASLNTFDKRGRSPIHAAAMCEDNLVLEAVISCLSDVNERDEKGNTALHIILENCVDELDEHKNGYVHIVQTLIARGADVNIKNNNDVSAIRLAAEKFHVELLKLFAINGADLKQQSDKDESLLHLVCKSSLKLRDTLKMIDTIDLLMSHGCDAKAFDKSGHAPLHYAAEFASVEVVQRLLELGADVNCRSSKALLTPLHFAAKADRLDSMRRLVEAGADVNAEAVDGSTPIFMSVLLGSFDSMIYLIDSGCDLYRRDKLEGSTLLHLAASSLDSSELSQDGTSEDASHADGKQAQKKCNYLIEKGFDVNDPGTCDVTPLHLATIALKADAVKSLIDHGANVNFQSDEFELAALHLASMKGNKEIIEMLIEAGGDVNRRGGPEQSTPLHFILMRSIEWHLGNIAVDAEESLLHLSPMRKIWPQNSGNLRFLTFNAFTVLIKSGADVNAKDNSGRSPLYFATLQDDSLLSKILLESGAHVNVQDNSCQSCLCNALENNNLLTLNNLLLSGADINDQDVCQQIMNSNDDLKEVVFQHAIKLQLLGLPLAPVYETPIQEPTFADFKAQCLQEIDTLMNYRIDDLSLYKFLRLSAKRQYPFVEKISSSYQILEKLFPLYFGIIRGTCREAIIRKSLLKSAKSAWTEISNVHLPCLCVDSILDQMSNRYLDALIVSAQPNQKVLTSESKMYVINGSVTNIWHSS